MSFAPFSTQFAPCALATMQARVEAELTQRILTERLCRDLPLYAERCLSIRTKQGAIRPLVFNQAQQHIHARLEVQRAAIGKVRALILKGRQQGCSTYVGGRFYHRATHEHGIRVFILTHEDAATQNLFEMVERFHAHCPPEQKQPTATPHRQNTSRSFAATTRPP